jgi:hypothetical protein
MNRISIALLVSLTPLLAAPTCHYKGVSPVVYPGTPEQMASDIAGNERRMNQAHTNGVLGITNWRDLEPCEYCGDGNVSCTNPPALPAGTEALHKVTVGTKSWWCGYMLEPLRAGLTAWVDPTAARPERRGFMAQIGPIHFFSGPNALPPNHPASMLPRGVPRYAEGQLLSGVVVRDNYRNLLNRVMPVFQQHVASGGPPALVGLGNEVNAYLNTQDSSAWGDYSLFVHAAKEYMDSNWPSLSYEAVSATWFGACGPGDWVASNGTTCATERQRVYDLMSLVDAQAFTYYPLGKPSCNQATSCYTSSTLGNQVATDLFYMAYFSALQGKPVLIQEAGFPSTAGTSIQTTSSIRPSPNGRSTRTTFSA